MEISDTGKECDMFVGFTSLFAVVEEKKLAALTGIEKRR